MSARASRGLQFVLLIVAVFAATFPVLHNNFINWDDSDQITLNPDFNPPRLQRMIEYWRGPYVGSLYPVSYDFFGLLAWIDRPPLEAQTFHAASIILHGIATILVWLILRQCV